MQRSVVLSDGWDIMDFVNQLQKLAAGNVAFATIPVLDEAGWSDDGMQSVVRVDPSEVQEWVAGLLHDQDEGKTEELAYSPGKTTAERRQRHRHQRPGRRGVAGADRPRDSRTGSVGNNEGRHVDGSQVQAAKADDLGAQAVSKELGGLPVVDDPSVTAGFGPGGAGQRLHRPGFGPRTAATRHCSTADPVAGGIAMIDRVRTTRRHRPILTAGSDDPECVN